MISFKLIIFLFISSFPVFHFHLAYMNIFMTTFFLLWWGINYKSFIIVVASGFIVHIFNLALYTFK